MKKNLIIISLPHRYHYHIVIKFTVCSLIFRDYSQGFDFEGNQARLAKAVLEELPSQVSLFMEKKGIKPGPGRPSQPPSAPDLAPSAPAPATSSAPKPSSSDPASEPPPPSYDALFMTDGPGSYPSSSASAPPHQPSHPYGPPPPQAPYYPGAPAPAASYLSAPLSATPYSYGANPSGTWTGSQGPPVNPTYQYQPTAYQPGLTAYPKQSSPYH